LTVGLLSIIGVMGPYNDIRELGAYGILGLAAAGALLVRHRWSVGLAAGIAAALIGAAVVWGARVAVRSRETLELARRARRMAPIILLVGCVPVWSACRQVYGGPPVVGRTDGLLTKRVRAKREPNELIAEDLTVCSVIPEVYAGIRPGDSWRCAWRYVPEGR